MVSSTIMNAINHATYKQDDLVVQNASYFGNVGSSPTPVTLLG